MPFPSPTLPPPALTIGQLYYEGLTFGGVVNGATFQIASIEGLGPPDVLSGDQQRAQASGEFPGLDLAPGQDITIVQNITAGAISGSKPTTAQLAALAAARTQMAGVLGPKGAEESPLYVQTEAGLYARMVRPRRHHFPWDSNVLVAGAVVATTMFHATDPRWYAAPSLTGTVSRGGIASGGLSFGGSGSGVSFGGPGSGVSFGGGGGAATISVVNAGTAEVWPVFVITGPCTNPKIVNLSLAGAPSLTFQTTMNAGDTLTIDSDFQTVSYLSAGSSSPSSRRSLLVAGSSWWDLPAESTTLMQFQTSDAGEVAATLTVESATAYVGI